jgi:hypothetical protein
MLALGVVRHGLAFPAAEQARNRKSKWKRLQQPPEVTLLQSKQGKTIRLNCGCFVPCREKTRICRQMQTGGRKSLANDEWCQGAIRAQQQSPNR